MVSRQSPDKPAVGCTGALLSFGYCCVEVCPKGGDVGLDLAGLDVGEDKAQGVSTGGMAEHLSQPSNVMSRSAPDFGLSPQIARRGGQACFRWLKAHTKVHIGTTSMMLSGHVCSQFPQRILLIQLS
jgi:hypothetical protein